MNSIRRPRSRPRVKSVSFRTFGWLLIREAYLRIQYRHTAEARYSHRLYVCQAHTTRSLQRRAADMIRRMPERRFYP